MPALVTEGVNKKACDMGVEVSKLVNSRESHSSLIQPSFLLSRRGFKQRAESEDGDVLVGDMIAVLDCPKY